MTTRRALTALAVSLLALLAGIAAGLELDRHATGGAP